MIANSSSIPLNQETLYLIEALKVESYWNLNNFTLTIQNKDIPLLNYIEKIVNSLEIKPSKRILLKIKLPDNTQKEEIDIFSQEKKVNFHISKSPFNKENVKAVTSLPNRNHKLIIHYKNKKFPLEIKTHKDKIITKSEFDCWVYGDLRFPTKKILTFLYDYTGGNNNLRIEKFLLNSKPELIMSAFSALVDCEGTITWSGLKREIQIRMKAKEYLLQWKNLLESLGIGCRFEKNQNLWGIVISGWEDFDRLEKLGFKLQHSKKIKKWSDMIKGFKRNQISRGSYKKFYIEKLKEINKRITANEFARIINKSKRTINHYLLKLEKEGLIKCDRNSWPYKYFIST